MLQLHGLPGEQAQDEVQDLGGQLGRAHPELHSYRDQQGAGGDHGAEPAGGRDRVGPGGPQAIHGREGDPRTNGLNPYSENSTCLLCFQWFQVFDHIPTSPWGNYMFSDFNLKSGT